MSDKKNDRLGEDDENALTEQRHAPDDEVLRAEEETEDAGGEKDDRADEDSTEG